MSFEFGFKLFYCIFGEFVEWMFDGLWVDGWMNGMVVGMGIFY